MVDFEAQVNGSHKRQSPVSAFAGQAANIVGDALELAELQAKLVKADATKTMQRALPALVLVAVASCAVIACLPVLVFGLASLLDSQTELNSWQSQLIVAGIGTLAAMVSAVLAAWRLRHSFSEFKRSTDELANNFAWAKCVVSSGRTPSERS